MCQDIWLYISMRYFNQKIKKEEDDTSIIQHKINPIQFENAEGNLGLANSLLEFFSRKLPISRLQRDFTDSTILRNIGVIFGHIELSFNNINKGLNKLLINNEKIKEDLNNNYSVITEGIQIILKKNGLNNSYEQLKKISRKSGGINKDLIDLFIINLFEEQKINENVKNKIIKLTVEKYI